MYVLLRRSSKVAKPAALSGKRKEEAILAARFFFIVVADCLCWLPIVAIKITALLFVDTPIPAKVYTWIAVFILPINSALNPIIYTLAAPTGLHEIARQLTNRLYYRFEAFFTFNKQKQHHHHHNLHQHHHHQNQHKSIMLDKKRKDTSASSATCDTLAISDTGKSSTAGLLTNSGDNSSANSRHSTPPASRHLKRSYLLCRCYRLMDKIFNNSSSGSSSSSSSSSSSGSNNNNRYTTTGEHPTIVSNNDNIETIGSDIVTAHEIIDEKHHYSPLPPPPYDPVGSQCEENVSFLASHPHLDNNIPALVLIQTDPNKSHHTVSAVVRDCHQPVTTTTTMIAINYINNIAPSGRQLTLASNNHNCLAAALQGATSATLAVRGINL